MDTIVVHCKCGRTLRAKAKLAGRWVKCPECQRGVFVAPAGTTELEIDDFDAREIDVEQPSRRAPKRIVTAPSRLERPSLSSKAPAGKKRQRQPGRWRSVLLAVVIGIFVILGLFRAIGPVWEALGYLPLNAPPRTPINSLAAGGQAAPNLGNEETFDRYAIRIPENFSRYVDPKGAKKPFLSFAQWERSNAGTVDVIQVSVGTGILAIYDEQRWLLTAQGLCNWARSTIGAPPDPYVRFEQTSTFGGIQFLRTESTAAVGAREISIVIYSGQDGDQHVAMMAITEKGRAMRNTMEAALQTIRRR